VGMPDDGTRPEGGRVLSLNSLATFASEPLTTKEFFALDVDEEIKVELIGGALVMSPSTRPWHGAVANRLLLILSEAFGPDFKVFADLDVVLDPEIVVRPDVFVARAETYDPDRVHVAADLVLAVEIVSPGSTIVDRKIKPALFRAAGIPSCRIERDDSRLYLVETPVHGDERQYLGTAELDISGVKIEIGLTAMAMDALGKRSSP
jgi:Uma2 family endonuclease